MKKPERINFRLDPEARRKLQKMCEITGLDEPSALRACVQAFIEHVEEHGGIWLPLAIVPKDNRPKPDAASPRVAAGNVSTEPPSGSTSPHRLNEDPPKQKSARLTPARRALRGMTARESRASE